MLLLLACPYKEQSRARCKGKLGYNRPPDHPLHTSFLHQPSVITLYFLHSFNHNGRLSHPTLRAFHSIKQVWNTVGLQNMCDIHDTYCSMEICWNLLQGREMQIDPFSEKIKKNTIAGFTAVYYIRCYFMPLHSKKQIRQADKDASVYAQCRLVDTGENFNLKSAFQTDRQTDRPTEGHILLQT